MTGTDKPDSSESSEIKLDKSTDTLTVYLGDEPIVQWIRGIGKVTMMHELLHGCEVILNGGIDSKLCVILIGEVNHKSFNYYISVKLKSVSVTLDKIMEYGLESEEYELCARVKKLYEIINEQPQI